MQPLSNNPTTPLGCGKPHPRGVEKTGVLHIGKIKYLNCLPYYGGWESSDKFQFEVGSPAQINRMMREGQVDVAPISSMEYLQNPNSYFLFPDLGIASTSLVRSVTLFSKKKIEDLNGAEIAVTEESLTSTHLLALILKGKYGIQAQLLSMPSKPKEMLENHDAALLIGNDALFAHPRKWIFRYDLGQLWHDWQKLPFVYAVWAIRREVAAHEPEMQEFYQALKERFLYNMAQLPELVQKQGSLGEFDKLYPKIFGYLSNLRYVLDESCWRGFEKFAELSEAREFCGKPDWQRASVTFSMPVITT